MSPQAPTPGGGGAPQQQQQQRRRRPRTRYGVQLHEKQELKKSYGIREEQLKKYYREALRAQGETGQNMISILESRLDNAIFRAGFAQTRAQARQMASHRFFSVNGRPTNIPSYALRAGDEVLVLDSKKDASYFSTFEKRMQGVRAPSWIELSPKSFGFKIMGTPEFEEANVGVDVRAIVEYFAR